MFSESLIEKVLSLDLKTDIRWSELFVAVFQTNSAENWKACLCTDSVKAQQLTKYNYVQQQLANISKQLPNYNISSISFDG